MLSIGQMLSIGELARLARVTTRTIRHYHAIGLMPEPPRSEGGYRQYGTGDLLRLLRVRRLSSLGLSLPQVAEALEAPEVQAQALLDQLDQELAAQVAVLQEQRRVLAVLREHAVNPELPVTFAPVLAALRRAGLAPAHLAQERELMLLFSALGAESALAGFYQDSSHEAAMQAYVGFTHRFEALRPLPPDDPAVDAVAAELIELQRTWLDHMRTWEADMRDLGPAVEQALSDHLLSQHGPAQRRVLAMAVAAAEAWMGATDPDPA